MGDPVALVAEHLLWNGISSHFPNVKPTTISNDWFSIILKGNNEKEYIVTDTDLELHLKIDYLKNLKFDLIDWYKYSYLEQWKTVFSTGHVHFLVHQ